jgi:hypothetical protein
MSTRAQVSFEYQYGDSKQGPLRYALIYCHCDGYPEAPHGLGHRIQEFFKEVKKQTNDTRFDCPEYLAAKFVVFLANGYATKGKPLDFLSVGVSMDEHGDIEYLYRIDCSKKDPETGFPVVTLETR